MQFTTLEWIVAACAAFIIGVSKTGVPGIGILSIPLIAGLFGGRLAVGTTLPLLIAADVFAVYWYRSHARWDKLVRLVPAVAAGFALGALALFLLAEGSGTRSALNVVIGSLVLVMLFTQLLRMRWGDRLNPSSPVGVALTGVGAGFATFVSNAAGPIMSIYMTSLGLRKLEFMGTSAWYFFIVNTAKIPVYLVLTALSPGQPLFSSDGLTFDLVMLPVVIAGVLAGRWALHRVPQRLFTVAVLILAAIAAVRLILG